MKIDFNLIKDIFEFIYNSSSYQIIGSSLSKQFDVYNENKISESELNESNEKIENDYQNKRNNFINHIQLLYDNKCLGIPYYPVSIEDLSDAYIRIMPNGYEFLYILNNYNLEEEINKNIPISIIIKKYNSKL
ncbi:hypothetical protein [Brachyspira hampsonii]|uniref:Uncharacterized protein n=1 Tax=Brachyspira hampsonii TaxID=1287055 RepID=A0AAC9TV37_9SPIR|nr:hypothetical protein [Brachyspira hampsonii]ASJ20961.1 hypothetical protein BHAMNSH16_04605 [Brachyspira hampsonii]ELV05029.1 hypothetical protein H263_12649 [Brachyspira hampsonii 30599]MBW5380977.1 hypothetical protein [Brachyspira hampsonii]OEJ13309.1 hypothetical protein A9496_02565 [Brachyspira hampsonii]